jgi:hypothetical protein
MLFMEGSEKLISAVSFGIRMEIRMGLRYAIRVQAAACKPGVLVKISSANPNMKPIRVMVELDNRNGSQRMNR